MRKPGIALIVVCLCYASACSPRDYLTRRLAADLIASSNTFTTQQQFWVRTGIISNKDYLSPEYMVLQQHGWLTGANVPCTPPVSPAPCWDVALTPAGVDAFRDLIPANSSPQYFAVPTARRELVQITGISKSGNQADVDFRWKWVPLNEVGEALYNRGVEYDSTVAFRKYDDGWRVVDGGIQKSNQGLDEALKNAAAAQ